MTDSHGLHPRAANAALPEASVPQAPAGHPDAERRRRFARLRAMLGETPSDPASDQTAA